MGTSDTPGAQPAPTVDTPATRSLDGSGLDFDIVRIEIPDSVEQSAERQGIHPSQLLRTIVIRRAEDDYLFVLIPGGRRIDWPKLRAHLGVSRLSLPDKDEAKEVTGYERGAITPFGASRQWPVIADASVLHEERVAIGGGARGVNLHLSSADLVEHLSAEMVDVSTEE